MYDAASEFNRRAASLGSDDSKQTRIRFVLWRGSALSFRPSLRPARRTSASRSVSRSGIQDSRSCSAGRLPSTTARRGSSSFSNSTSEQSAHPSRGRARRRRTHQQRGRPATRSKRAYRQEISLSHLRQTWHLHTGGTGSIRAAPRRASDSRVALGNLLKYVSGALGVRKSMAQGRAVRRACSPQRRRMKEAPGLSQE